MRASDFYAETVLPALMNCLDRAFPEFGWRPDTRGWVATNEEHTHTRLGARAERVVAHGPAPRGFLVHGGEPMLWTAYVNGGIVPRGADFVRTVREIAERASIDTAPLDRPQPRDRRADLLHDFFELCRRELAGERGGAARTYLERRGFPQEAIAASALGVVPASVETSRLLESKGYRPKEIATAGVLADSRWPGRLCGAWRSEYGRIGTLWARSLDTDAAPEARYLYLRGASRTNLPPYGLPDVLAGPHNATREIILVEGFLDLHQLRAQGIANIAALGGTSIRPQTFDQLHRFGIETVTLCLDNDEAGRAATARAVEQSVRAQISPQIYVVDPKRLSPSTDPDDFVRARGPHAWLELIASRTCGIEWRAQELVIDVTRESPTQERRSALARAGRWLGTLPPRLALEQEEALFAIADRCGYSSEAVARTFRARFWSPPQRARQPSRSRSTEHVLER